MCQENRDPNSSESESRVDRPPTCSASVRVYDLDAMVITAAGYLAFSLLSTRNCPVPNVWMIGTCSPSIWNRHMTDRYVPGRALAAAVSDEFQFGLIGQPGLRFRRNAGRQADELHLGRPFDRLPRRDFDDQVPRRPLRHDWIFGNVMSNDESAICNVTISVLTSTRIPSKSLWPKSTIGQSPTAAFWIGRERKASLRLGRRAPSTLPGRRNTGRIVQHLQREPAPCNPSSRTTCTGSDLLATADQGIRQVGQVDVKRCRRD